MFTDVIFCLAPFVGIVSALYLLRSTYSMVSIHADNVERTKRYFWALGGISAFAVLSSSSFLFDLPSWWGNMEYYALFLIGIFVFGCCFGAVVYKERMTAVSVIYPLFWGIFTPSMIMAFVVTYWLIFGFGNISSQ